MRTRQRIGGRRHGLTATVAFTSVIVVLLVVCCDIRAEAEEAAPRTAPREDRAEQERAEQSAAPSKDATDPTFIPDLVPLLPSPPAAASTPVPPRSPPPALAAPVQEPALRLVEEAPSPGPSSVQPRQQPRTKWYHAASCAGLGVSALAFGIGAWQGGIAHVAQIEFATARVQTKALDAKRRGEVAAERANWWFIGGGALVSISTVVLVWSW